MQTRLILKPGEKGTRKLTAQYGDRLVCVRYRYDAETKKRFKTVELVVEEAPWAPSKGPFAFFVEDGGTNPLTAQRAQEAAKMTASATAAPGDAEVGIKIAWGETELRERVKQAGAKWSAGQKVWRLSYVKVLELGLEGRIAPSAGSGSTPVQADDGLTSLGTSSP